MVAGLWLVVNAQVPTKILESGGLLKRPTRVGSVASKLLQPANFSALT